MELKDPEHQQLQRDIGCAQLMLMFLILLVVLKGCH